MESLRRILIVDDEEDWRRALRITLQRAGFQIDAASTAAEAWEFIRSNAYDLAILDISLTPGDSSNDDGMRLLRQLAEGGLLGPMRIVILSAHVRVEFMREAVRLCGVADFLNKADLDPDLFVGQVQEILAGR